MSQHNHKHTDANEAQTDKTENLSAETPEVAVDDNVKTTADDGKSEMETLKDLLESKTQQLEKEKKEYLFLMAEFDNFRKRTLREKSDIIRNAAESVLKGLLHILDDFERGLEAAKSTPETDAVMEGMQLIYHKLVKYMEQNGVKAMESTGAVFDPELHEAIAMVPAAVEEMRGKIIDTVSKGYMLNDKVLRHAKVAVGQ